VWVRNTNIVRYNGILEKLAEGVSTEGGWKSYGIFDFSSLIHVSLHDEKWRRLGQHEPNARHGVEVTHL
jgi:hypothetical protein